MCCLWHGEGKFLFILSLGKREMIGDGEGNGEGFLSVACLPWESLCCFERESCRAVSVVAPRRDAQGQACTKHFEQKCAGSVSLLLCSWL